MLPRRRNPFRLVPATAAVASGLAATAAAPAPVRVHDPALAPCEALAAYARTVKPEAWKDGARALAPRLRIDAWRPADPVGRNAHPPSVLEARIAALPWVKRELADEDGSWTVFIDHLAGTDLYAAATFQGTLHCQTAVVLVAQPGRPPRRLSAAPFDQGEGGLCWTQEAALGRVDGRPAAVAHGARSQTDPTEDVAITPLPGERWGRGCRLTLTYRTAYDLTHRLCPDAAACVEADPVVLDIARAYNRKRREDAESAPFAFGPPPSPQMQAKAKQIADGLGDVGTLDFPAFGGTGGGGFSYSGFTIFPLRLGERTVVAAIGHEGVGWRENDNTLLAIYDSTGPKPVPLAGFVVRARVSGLASATPGEAKGTDRPFLHRKSP